MTIVRCLFCGRVLKTHKSGDAVFCNCPNQSGLYEYDNGDYVISAREINAVTVLKGKHNMRELNA